MRLTPEQRQNQETPAAQAEARELKARAFAALNEGRPAQAMADADAVMAARTRQLMRHRWQVLAGELEAGGEFPAVSAMARALLGATAGWQADELPLYPALR